MTPTPQIETQAILKNCTTGPSDLKGEKIIISGISGLYPKARNVKELSNILYNQENPVISEDSRWTFKHREFSAYLGKAPNIDRFDNQFFSIPYRLTLALDPVLRKLLEQVFGALYDAGLSPKHLSEKKVGVFIGCSFSDWDKTVLLDTKSKLGLGMIGCSKAMLANRLSFWLNLRGPSFIIDDSDCSTTSALEAACSAMRQGDCEAAIVGGASACMHPFAVIARRRLGGMTDDGTTKSYAENSEGFSLSEALGIMFLQKSKDALRNYAEVLHVKNGYTALLKDSFGPKFERVRDPKLTANFIKDFYNEAQIAPDDVEYLEGYGTGIPDDDKAELEAFEEVYCKDRNKPLLIGSVASNIGVTEAASGFSSITKVLLGYYTGELAANLNCENPRKDIAALRDGRMRIVSKNEQFGRTYVAINGMSITGINSHVLLRGHYKPKNLLRYKSSIPHLVLLSARNELFLQNLIDGLKSRPVDAEELALLHNIYSKNIGANLERGYVILDTDAEKNTVSICEKIQHFDDTSRPLWFVYSGMGSQWAGMGAQLMRMPVFAAAIERCQEVLKPTGLDLIHIITTTDKTIFDNILHSFVGIAAIQIGLTDILREIGLEPDGIIGHSAGELGCGYGDGCLTTEEMILSAYIRGKISLEVPFIHGAMAAIGLGYKQISPMCPPEIEVACHNSPNSSTISGPADAMKEFVHKLNSKGIFAKEVQVSNIAYHSRYIAEAGPHMLKRLKKVIKSPKLRTKRWISTSVPQDQWDLTSAKYSTAEYFTQNLLNPVLFEETSHLIPKNAVLIEIAPHGLLQAILKRSLPNCRNVPLTRRGCGDSPSFLLQAIGDVYIEGYSLNVQALYPKVEFPVSTATPMLSDRPEWIHDEKWPSFYHAYELKETAPECKFIISIYDDDYKYLKGNVIQGKTCYPFSAALVAAWDMLAMFMGVPKREVSVAFHDLHLHAQPLLLDQQPLEITIAMQRGFGRFQIVSQHSIVMSGYMNAFKNHHCQNVGEAHIDNDITLTSEDLYQLLKDKDYNYSEEFCGIEQASASFDKAALVWNNNWVTLIDSMLQLNVLRQRHHGVSQPTHIKTISIDYVEHFISCHDILYKLNGKNVINVNIDEERDVSRCGGIKIQGIQFSNLPSIVNRPLELCISPTESSIVNDTNAQFNILEKILTLQSEQIGNLDSLRWVELPHFEKYDATVMVQFAGLNLLDVSKAAGITSCNSNAYGMAYSGLTKSGDRVMGIVESGAASTHVRALPELLWPVPDHWSLEDAATVPFTYAHAFYVLAIKGGLEPGMRVLVSGGTGALGLAVIAISLAHNCEVFATVSDISKKQFLLKKFPRLSDDHILYSRDGTFVDKVFLATDTRGCNIVINCAKGELKDAYQKCSGPYGRFIDTVQAEHHENNEYDMGFLSIERSYVLTDFSSIFEYNNREEMKALQRMVSDGIACGYVVPLPRVTYAMNEVPRAFSLLAANQHRGKVLLRMVDDKVQALQRMSLNPAQYQVLIWNDNVIGSGLADKLIKQGAKKLYVSFSELTTFQRYKIRAWEELGVKVVVSSEDKTQSKSFTDVLNDAIKLGTVEGIFVVIANANNIVSKALSSDLNNLDIISRIHCPHLRFFAVVSAVKALGQNICLSRAKDRLIASYLDISSLSNDELKQSGDVVELIERAVCSTHVVLEVIKRDAQPVDLLEQLASIAGITIPKNIDPHVTLEQLGVADRRAQLICQYMNLTYNIFLEEKDLSLFTIEQLNELHNSLKGLVPTEEKGLSAFLSYFDANELVATVELIELPTLLPDDNYNADEQYLYIIPGIEGHHERFRSLCRRLKMPALVLQPGVDHLDETERETAQRYAEVLFTKTKIKDNFYILGYESGVAVALELAAILEDKGLQGTVFCVGGTPNQVQAEIKRQLPDLETRTQLQDAVLRHIVALRVSEIPKDLEDALQHNTWEQKLDVYVRLLRSDMPFSQQYSRAFIEAAIARIERAQQWSTSGRLLRSRLILLGAATSSIQDSAALQQYSRQPVIVHQLQSPLSHVLRNMQCPSLINSYLDSDILNNFNKMNLCDNYLLDMCDKLGL